MTIVGTGLLYAIHYVNHSLEFEGYVLITLIPAAVREAEQDVIKAKYVVSSLNHGKPKMFTSPPASS